MRVLRTLLIGVAAAAIWPAYLVLLAYLARVGPWLRTVARPLAVVLLVVAAARLATGLARFLFRSGGWVEVALGVPGPVCRQFRRAVVGLTTAAVVLLLPAGLLDHGLIAPGGRPVAAPTICRMLGLIFEVVAGLVAWRLGRRRSELVEWLNRSPERLGWWGRHRRPIKWATLGAIAGVIGLDATGYSFTARRLAAAGLQSVLLIGLCALVYWLCTQAIDHHSRYRQRSGLGYGGGGPARGETGDQARRLKHLAGVLVPLIGLGFGAWVWDVDLALFRTLGNFPLWTGLGDEGTPVVFLSLGDVTQAAVALLITIGAWRHLGDLFALVVFPRMPEDPGVRFAVLTLCRYLVLGLGSLVGLSALHLGMEKIGMVLAALGVGLGFGLQEIVSNFVSGIILLLERPIRVGDVVTVAGMSGKVDRINIRATTIINWENQSIIVPNREFISGELVNWTHKDKVIRVSIHVGVAYGSDPDRVSDLLLTIAREDADVLRNPVPAAFMESFGDSALNFVLHVHVPDPSLGPRVRHRLCTQVQKRFQAAGIGIPFPMRELLVRPTTPEGLSIVPSASPSVRFAPASPTPPPHHVGMLEAARSDEIIHRTIDE